MFGLDERVEVALEFAYRYLNRRDRTVAEVRHHLDRHGVDDRVVKDTVDALIERRFLDDSRFARLFVEDKRELEQWGSGRIRRALMERGIEPELIEHALRDEADSELDRALELLRRRFPSPPHTRRERDRALGMMLRKGYDSELAIDALTVYARDST